MARMPIALLAVVVALSGSSAASAQMRKMTDQDRLQMQKELQWEKQQKLKADRDARTTYTQKCQMVGGRMHCQGAQPAGTAQPKPVAVAPAKTVTTDAKLGTAYGNQKNNLPDPRAGYQVNTYTTVTPNKPHTNTYAPYVSRKYISQ